MKNRKYLGVQDLYTENYKIEKIKELKKDISR